jgi:hypothetical protein
MDFYDRAWRRALRAYLEQARAQARRQLAASGVQVTAADVDRLLARSWYKLPDGVASLVWSANDRRQRAAAGRPRGLNATPSR